MLYCEQANRVDSATTDYSLKDGKANLFANFSPQEPRENPLGCENHKQRKTKKGNKEERFHLLD